jgi:hypothetical protein
VPGAFQERAKDGLFTFSAPSPLRTPYPRMISPGLRLISQSDPAPSTGLTERPRQGDSGGAGATR